MNDLFKYTYTSCHTYDRIVGVVRAITPEDAKQKVMKAVTEDLLNGMDMNDVRNQQFFKDRMDELYLIIEPIEFKNDMAELCMYEYR